jgi:hypothetical protein
MPRAALIMPDCFDNARKYMDNAKGRMRNTKGYLLSPQ